ncbi:MAG: molybdopterin-dependent oxidoreductase [Dehalococcoidia bacterium]|nr:molybdopterin-dependent oxidoreductase [Dehalococcoidia bacterium]MYH67815.1 molybdopterin-dependent oxidoreductase [Dehalococcoidia bacterium]MYI85404.1 molybdopterin-dependent oxidoreductase [Dehalococcoidia bacterium]
MVETKKSFCRFCHAFCAIEVDVEDNKVIEVRGDTSDPIYGGYTCIKGRHLPDQHNHSERLRTSLKRMPDGSFQPIPSEQALDEIAEKLRSIIDEHGPRSVASYNGTYAFCNAITLSVTRAWHAGIKSPSYYTSVTIDQPAKAIAASRHGTWLGGSQNFETADVAMLIGNNPVVSMFGGIPPFNPWKRLRDAQKRGLKLIVIDPRESDVAKRADLYLQVKPGEDPTLLAGIVRVMFEEGLVDGDFLAGNVAHVEDLRQAVDSFTLDYVEERTGVAAALVERAARMFAEAQRGVASSGTGANMSPHPNLTEHFVQTLNTLCGRYLREGEVVPNPGVIGPERPFTAQAMPPNPAWGKGEPSRVRGLGEVFGEMPTAALSDEIITPGEGRVRALISVGGNPVGAWPDQLKTIEAMKHLDLNVSLDIKMSQTAKLADYVIAPKLSLERPDLTVLTDSWYPEPYAHYTPAMVEAEDDVMEEWEFFWGIAHRLGTEINLPAGPLPMDKKPTTDEVLDVVAGKSRIPLDEVRAVDGGGIFEREPVRVAPKAAGTDARLDAAPPDLVEEIAEVRAQPIVEGAGYVPGEEFSHRLISRRMREFYNSSGRDIDGLTARDGGTNPAFMNPRDAAQYGIEDGAVIEIESSRATILGVAAFADDVPSGVISMAHSWGDVPEMDQDVRSIGGSTNRLVNNEEAYDPITGMARQSAIPVNIRPAKEPVGAS